jgi:hypothetical protein
MAKPGAVPDLSRVAELVRAMLRLPFFESLPGGVLEEILANVYGGKRTGTYDFVDVYNAASATGWQVKSTQKSTPVTWKRAKIPNKVELIDASRGSRKAAQELGDAIIDFCNHHAAASVSSYGLKRLVYARLVDHMSGDLTYFEKELPLDGRLFDPRDFEWRWSEPKKATKKEQLPALHGIHRRSGVPWFAWHGLSENQLHFKGEAAWWPPRGARNRIDFKKAPERVSLPSLAEVLAKTMSG